MRTGPLQVEPAMSRPPRVAKLHKLAVFVEWSVQIEMLPAPNLLRSVHARGEALLADSPDQHSLKSRRFSDRR
jgi:hypothetical protein